MDVEVKKNDKIRLQSEQNYTQKNKEIKSDGNFSGLIQICEDKKCLLEKFNNCEPGQYVIDPKVQFKAYFLVNGLINDKCVVLIEKDMKNGTLCKLPKEITRDESMLNNLLTYNFNNVKNYCDSISSNK